MLFVEKYPGGTTDFTPILTRVRAANPDLLGAAAYFISLRQRVRCGPGLVEAIKRAGSPDGEKIREAILRIDLNAVYGGFKVDPAGFQIATRWSRSSGRTARR